MSGVQRRHVTLKPETSRFLEQFQRTNELDSFSAAVEAAVESLRLRELEVSYRQFAADYAADGAAQEEAEAWLNIPMDES